MNHTQVTEDPGLQAVRAFMDALPGGSSVVDFEEQMQLPAVRATLRTWQQGARLSAFAYVDNYCNLWFDVHPAAAELDELYAEITAWGEACVRRMGEGSLDHSCRADDLPRLGMLEKHGFVPQDLRTLRFRRELTIPLHVHPLPDGFSMRPVAGRQEVEALVVLHRAAFGTEHMDVPERLAIMDAPLYCPELDRVAVAPGGELAAFCICGFEDAARTCGYTDPIGVHPRYRRMGLGRVLMSAGLGLLRQAGACRAELGTTSDNLPMQRLAESLGFVCVSEKMWFSKEVG